MSSRAAGLARPRSRVLTLARPLDLRATLVVKGLKGPSLQVRGDGLWRATRTPEGPTAVRMSISGGELTAEAWGPGAGWALDRAPEWVGHRFRVERRSVLKQNAGLQLEGPGAAAVLGGPAFRQGAAVHGVRGQNDQGIRRERIEQPSRLIRIDMPVQGGGFAAGRESDLQIAALGLPHRLAARIRVP